MFVPDDVRKNVFFLGYLNDDGIFVPTGTAFLVEYEQSGSTFLYAVTAEHVIVRLISENKKIYGRINLKDGNVFIAPIGSAIWHYHPDATALADVAVCPFPRAMTIHGVSENGQLAYPDYAAIPCNGNWASVATKIVCETREIGTGHEIAIAGLFVNHHGRERNFPIIRIGNIAAMDDEPLSTKSGLMDAYLIEARSIGGLSGSPVFAYMPVPRVAGAVIRLAGGVNRGFLLLGLMHGHFDVSNLNQDSVVDDSKAGATGSVHAGIGIVIPVEKIIETLEGEDLQKMRTEHLDPAVRRTRAIPDGT